MVKHPRWKQLKHADITAPEILVTRKWAALKVWQPCYDSIKSAKWSTEIVTLHHQVRFVCRASSKGQSQVWWRGFMDLSVRAAFSKKPFILIWCILHNISYHYKDILQKNILVNRDWLSVSRNQWHINILWVPIGDICTHCQKRAVILLFPFQCFSHADTH